MSTQEPSSTRLILTLGVAGMLSGFLLVGVYLLTLPRITQNRAEAIQRAVLKVLPGSTRAVPYVVSNGALAEFERKGNELPTVDAVYAGVAADGHQVGWAVPAQGPGFADVIKVLYGFDPSRQVIVGLEVLESKETPGLGDKINDDKEFHQSFKALAVKPNVVAAKRGPPTQPNEVDAISGATISSESVVKLINRSLKQWLPLLLPPVQTSQLPTQD